MLESIIDPRKSEREPWKMFFVGLIYASLSLILVHFLFSNDPSLSKASGILVVTFCVMFTLPYMYFIIKIEEKKDEKIDGLKSILICHKDALYAFIWLFLGFIVAFSIVHIIFQDANLLNFQLETYCRINSPGEVDSCVSQHLKSGALVEVKENLKKHSKLFSIIENNIYVMIFTLLFSLIFGAGAIFILVWNASVITTAIGIFTNHQLSEIPRGILRYMIHGFPEIAAYFITALAGGMFGVGVLRHGLTDKRSLKVLQHSILLLFIAILFIVVGGIIEVYFTFRVFK